MLVRCGSVSSQQFPNASQKTGYVGITCKTCKNYKSVAQPTEILIHVCSGPRYLIFPISFFFFSSIYFPISFLTAFNVILNFSHIGELIL